jgi:hypothetical protein
MFVPVVIPVVCMHNTVDAGGNDVSAVTDLTVTTAGGGGMRAVVSRSLAGLNPFRQRNSRTGHTTDDSSSSDATGSDSNSSAIAGMSAAV